jgi:uncharacterized protein DUF3592
MATNDPIPSRRENHLFATSEPRVGLFRLFPPATRTELWGGLAFIVLSLLGTAWVIKCRSEALALERDAVTIDGTVVRLWVTPGRGSGVHHVAYEYRAPSEVEARTFQGETTTLSDEHFARLEEGGPIAVKVCRTDPPNHQVVGASTRVFASTAALAFSLGVLALLTLAGVINLWWWWISHRRSGPAQVFILDVRIVQ